MATFRFSYTEHCERYVDIEADTEEAAREAFWAGDHDDGYETGHLTTEIDRITDITKVEA